MFFSLTGCGKCIFIGHEFLIMLLKLLQVYGISIYTRIFKPVLSSPEGFKLVTVGAVIAVFVFGVLVGGIIFLVFIKIFCMPDYSLELGAIFSEIVQGFLLQSYLLMQFFQAVFSCGF